VTTERKHYSSLVGQNLLEKFSKCEFRLVAASTDHAVLVIGQCLINRHLIVTFMDWTENVGADIWVEFDR